MERHRRKEFLAPKGASAHARSKPSGEPPRSSCSKDKNRLCHAKGIAEPIQSVSAETAPFGQFALHSNMDFYDGSEG